MFHANAPMCLLAFSLTPSTIAAPKTLQVFGVFNVLQTTLSQGLLVKVNFRVAENWCYLARKRFVWLNIIRSITHNPKPEQRRSRGNWLIPISLLVAVLLWELVVRAWELPAFMLPYPGAVARRFWQLLLDGSLVYHSLFTLMEVVIGMAIGVGAASLLGYLLAKSPTAERLLAPYLVASQSVPVVAIAPLLVIWLGSGISSKVLVCALDCFLPGVN